MERMVSNWRNIYNRKKSLDRGEHHFVGYSTHHFQTRTTKILLPNRIVLLVRSLRYFCEPGRIRGDNGWFHTPPSAKGHSGRTNGVPGILTSLNRTEEIIDNGTG
jgi:hypothetical protein